MWKIKLMGVLINLAFIEYKVGPFKQQVKNLLRNRLDLKAKIRRHKKLSNNHIDKIKEIETILLPEVEKKLNFYLDRAKDILPVSKAL